MNKNSVTFITAADHPIRGAGKTRIRLPKYTNFSAGKKFKAAVNKVREIGRKASISTTNNLPKLSFEEGLIMDNLKSLTRVKRNLDKKLQIKTLRNNKSPLRGSSVQDTSNKIIFLPKEINSLRTKKWNDYYSEKKKVLSRAISLDRESIGNVPDHTGASEMLPVFLKYKQTLMKRRILTDMNLKAKSEWSQTALLDQLKMERNERRRQMHHEIWRRAIAHKTKKC
ncbi:unnamed protein product [Moneuplotes crassus]|uniref:Uncharacterized protein n=1 Tax=Euplotes crassus TaxID=5936 RepID=A0AAD1XSR3_EUPCR|nr:unnamed protein product [Moneuplotes crassus]